MQGYPLYNRTSNVRGVSILTITESAVFQIGDSTFINARGRAMSLMRNYSIFNGNELYFKNHSAFHVPIPRPTFSNDVLPKMFYPDSKIYVDSIKIKSVAGDACLHIGSTHSVHLEYRVQQIRNRVRGDRESYALYKLYSPTAEEDIYNVDTDPLDPCI